MKSLFLLAASVLATPASAFSIVSLHSGPAQVVNSTVDITLVATGLLAIAGVVAMRLARATVRK
jgi:hypothetical protein